MKTHPKIRLSRPSVRIDELPLFCDYHCPHASFTPSDAVGACRKEVGVYCVILNAYTAKNGSCLARKRLGGERESLARGTR